MGGCCGLHVCTPLPPTPVPRYSPDPTVLVLGVGKALRSWG